MIPEKGSAQINSDAVKTSAGALNFIPVARVKNLFYTCRDLQKMGLSLIAITEKTEKLMYEGDFASPVALIMGSEEDGISQEIMGMVDDRVKNPAFRQYRKFKCVRISWNSDLRGHTATQKIIKEDFK